MIFVLILVMSHPNGSPAVTSQAVSGYMSATTCQTAAAEASKHKGVILAFCIGKEIR